MLKQTRKTEMKTEDFRIRRYSLCGIRVETHTDNS